MAVLILNAGTASPISLTVQSAGENAPTEVGSVTPSFNLVDRSSVRGVKRNYGSMTTIVDTATKDSIINLLKWGNQIPCSGDLLGNIQTQCTVRYTGASMKAGLGGSFWEVGLTLSEVQPNNTLLRYSPGDTITGESFSRSTTATFRNSGGNLQLAGINVKRDAHYVLGTRATLLEDARTNVLIRSEELETASWTKANSTINGNATTSPDGTATADKLEEDATTNSHFVYQATTMTASSWQAFTFFAKAAERLWVYCQTSLKDGSGPTTWFNLSTGLFGTTSGSHTVRATPFANGWYRIEIVVSSATGGTTPLLLLGVSTADNTIAYTGALGNGIYLWGAQHEKDQAFASSYIPTTTVPVTRGADSYSLPFTTPPQEMTVYAKFVEGGTAQLIAGARLYQIGNAASDAPAHLVYSPSGVYVSYHSNVTIAVVSAAPAAPVIGDTAEIVARVFGDGSVDITQSINAAASTSGAQSAAANFATAWSAPAFCWLNGVGSIGRGFTALQSFKIVAGARSLAEMRAA